MVAVVLVATSDPPRVHAGTAAGDDSVVFVGAGDIANCEILGGARATASLLDQIDGAIFTLGDHAYQHGSDKEFRDCYEPTWGRHKARTHPTVGNHDMITDHGRPYFKYFGENAGPDERGYYSFDLGAWHIISLNYERFAPQDNKGKLDPERGIREFIVGTGGGGVYEFKRPAANSEVRNNTTYGVLKLTLSPGHYAWEFIPTAGQKFHDDGSAACSPAR